MDWSSDDALTPAPKTYARDFYYDDSDDDSPAAKATPAARPASAAQNRRAARDGRAVGSSSSETPTPTSATRHGRGAHEKRLAAASNPGASLCAEGDQLALGFDVPRDSTAAFALYVKAAEAHEYPPAYARVGRCFLAEGGGAPDGPDEDKAAEWFERGAETHDDVPCLVALGEAHERRGDRETAARHFKRAKESARNARTPGAREARAHVARFAEFGLCASIIPSDAQMALKENEALAKEGCAPAQRALGVVALRDAEATPAGAAREARLETARALLASAAAAGDAEAINQLGIMHEDGFVGTTSPSSNLLEARRLYARAARLGHERATNNLGFACAAAGEHAEAARHFRAAALVHGDADAAHNLGNYHETGVGVEKDLREAARLYAEAAAKGHEAARDAATRLAAETTREDDEPPESSGAASLRRRLAAKENETARLAKDLGEAKAETTRLKGKIAELKLSVAEMEKAKARAEKAASGGGFARAGGFPAGARETSAAAAGASGSPGGAEKTAEKTAAWKPEFARSTSLRSDRTTHSNYSAYSGLSGVSAREAAGDPSGAAREGSGEPFAKGSHQNSGSSTPGGSSSAGGGAGPRAKRSRNGGDAARLAAQRRASLRDKGLGSGKSGFAGVFGMLSGAGRSAGGGSSVAGGGDKAVDRDIMKAHARDVTALKHELESVRFQAEVHEEMSSSLSTLLKSTYARNLQLEDLLKSVGLDADDPAVAKDLHPIKLDHVAGITVGDVGVFRDGAPGKNDALSLAPAAR